MANKRHEPNETAQRLRKIEVLFWQGAGRVDAIRKVCSRIYFTIGPRVMPDDEFGREYSSIGVTLKLNSAYVIHALTDRFYPSRHPAFPQCDNGQGFVAKNAPASIKATRV